MEIVHFEKYFPKKRKSFSKNYQFSLRLFFKIFYFSKNRTNTKVFSKNPNQKIFFITQTKEKFKKYFPLKYFTPNKQDNQNQIH